MIEMWYIQSFCNVKIINFKFTFTIIYSTIINASDYSLD